MSDDDVWFRLSPKRTIEGVFISRDEYDKLMQLGSDTLALLEDFKAGGTLHCTINIWDDMIARWQEMLKQ